MTDHGRTTIDAASLGEEGRAALDVALGHLSEADRAAYWASVTKCFNAPYQEREDRRAADGPIRVAPLVEALVPVPPKDGAEREHAAS